MTGSVSPFLQVEDGFPKITSLFRLFFIFWDVCSKRGTEYTAGQVLNITDIIYEMLRDFWVRDANDEMLNPNLFLDKKLPYILHLRNWYLIS